MKQVVCVKTASDARQAVAIVDAEEPRCPEDGAVIAVRARPINPADLLLLQGRHVYAPELPAPVGIEGAGIVVEAGRSSKLRPGALVAIPFGGTWRERIAMRDEDVIPLPDDLDLEQAAMLSVNPLTALGLLEGVPPGTCIALNAATSAVSSLILALCKRRSIAAIAIVRDLSSASSLIERGAHAVIADGPDLSASLRRAAPSQIVRGLDAVAGDAGGRLFDGLDEGAALIVYGLLSDDQLRLPAAKLVFRDVTVRGYTRLRALRALTPSSREQLIEALVSGARDGLWYSPVEARYPLEQVSEALAHHERPGRRGKVLLVS